MKPTLTPHAVMRRREMGVTEDEIEAVLAEPELVYPTWSQRRCYQRGRLVVVANEEREVITLLWHRKEGREDLQPP